jgi:hypothetical protein
MTTANEQSEALAAATERRVELKDAISGVERAAASPSAMPSWRDYVLRELDMLRLALDRHVAEVEGSYGLLAELTTKAPRLAYKIDQVRDEHPGLVRMVDDTIILFNESDDTEAIRASILETLFAIVRHRQRGADLVFDGYNVDIGGGG